MEAIGAALKLYANRKTSGSFPKNLTLKKVQPMSSAVALLFTRQLLQKAFRFLFDRLCLL